MVGPIKLPCAHRSMCFPGYLGAMLDTIVMKPVEHLRMSSPQPRSIEPQIPNEKGSWEEEFEISGTSMHRASHVPALT